MSEIDALLDAEAEYAEQHRDVPAEPGTKVSRPGHGRSEVFSVRLNADEVAALEAAADEAGLPASTLARSWILDRLKYSGPAGGLDLRKLVRNEIDQALRQRNEQATNALRDEMLWTGASDEPGERLRRILAWLSAIPLPVDVPQARSAPSPAKPEATEKA